MVFSLFIFYVGDGVVSFFFIFLDALGLMDVCYWGGILLLSSGILVGVSVGGSLVQGDVGIFCFPLLFFLPLVAAIALGLLYYDMSCSFLPSLGLSVVEVLCEWHVM